MSVTEEDLLEQERKLTELKKQIREKQLREHERKLHVAENRKLSDADLAMLKAAFAKFDKSNSNTISLEELRLLSKELGVEMSDEESARYMKELDLDGNGSLCFEEFKAWWCADASRGGNKGVRLQLLKRRLEAALLRDEAVARLKNVAKVLDNRANDAMPMSAEFNVVVGEMGGDAANASSAVDVIVMPQDAQKFKAFAENHPWAASTPNLQHAFEVSFEAQDDADPDVIKALCDQLTGLNELFQETLHPGISFQFHIQGKSVVLRVTVTVTEDDEDPLAEPLAAINEITSGGGLQSIFQSLTITLLLKESVEKLLVWDSDAKLLSEILDNMQLVGNARFSRSAASVGFSNVLQRGTASQRKNALLQYIGVASVSSLNVAHRFDSMDAIRVRLVDTVTSITLAKLHEVEPPLPVETIDSLIPMFLSMKEKILARLRREDLVNKLSPPDALAKVVKNSGLLGLKDEVPDSVAALELLSLLSRIHYITANNAHIALRINFKNWPIFGLFKDIKTHLALVNKAKAHLRTQQAHKAKMFLDREKKEIVKMLGKDPKVQKNGERALSAFSYFAETLELLGEAMTKHKIVETSESARDQDVISEDEREEAS